MFTGLIIGTGMMIQGVHGVGEVKPVVYGYHASPYRCEAVIDAVKSEIDAVAAYRAKCKELATLDQDINHSITGINESYLSELLIRRDRLAIEAKRLARDIPNSLPKWFKTGELVK